MERPEPAGNRHHPTETSCEHQKKRVRSGKFVKKRNGTEGHVTHQEIHQPDKRCVQQKLPPSFHPEAAHDAIPKPSAELPQFPRKGAALTVTYNKADGRGHNDNHRDNNPPKAEIQSLRKRNPHPVHEKCPELVPFDQEENKEYQQHHDHVEASLGNDRSENFVIAGLSVLRVFGYDAATDKLPDAREHEIGEIADVHRIESGNMPRMSVHRKQDFTPSLASEPIGEHADENARRHPPPPAAGKAHDKFRPVHSPETEIHEQGGHCK